MKRSEIYTAAAELIDAGQFEFTCCTIDWVQRVNERDVSAFTPARRAYAEFMLGLNPAADANSTEGRYNSPDIAELFEMYDSGKAEDWRAARVLRVLLLLTMAAVAEAEGD